MSEAAQAFAAVVDSLDWLIGAVIGAAAALTASGMSSRATRRRDRDRLAVEFLTIYVKDIHGHFAVGISGLGAQPGSQPHYEAQLVGNWFEVFAGLIVLGHASGDLVEDAGLKAEMRAFWDAAVAARQSGGSIDPAKDWSKLGDYLR